MSLTQRPGQAKIQALLDKHSTTILAMIETGHSINDVARALGVPRSTSEVLVKHFAPQHQGPKTKQMEARQRIRDKHGDWILDQIAAGKTQRSIGDQLGIKKDLMSKIVKELRSDK